MLLPVVQPLFGQHPPLLPAQFDRGCTPVDLGSHWADFTFNATSRFSESLYLTALRQQRQTVRTHFSFFFLNAEVEALW